MSTAGCGGNSCGGNNGSGSIVLGCGMESGKVFIHDLRKMNSRHDDPIVLLNQHNTNSMMEGRDRIDDANADHDDLLISSQHYASVDLGMNPVLTLDMRPSHDKDHTIMTNTKTDNDKCHENQNKMFGRSSKRSLVTK